MQDKIYDIHCHILPNIDDGPSTMEESLQMVQMAVQQGIGGIVATPHFIPDDTSYSRAELHQRIHELQKRIDQAGMQCVIYPGMELYLSPGIISAIDQGRVEPIGGKGKYILVEFPESGIPENLINLLYEIQIRGYTSIIAHPERNGDMVRNPQLVNELLQYSVHLQVNASSVIGKSGKEIQRVALEFIQQGLVSFIASDGHSVARRNINLEAVYAHLQKIITPEELEKLFRLNALSVIDGKIIEPIHGVYKEAKTGFWGNLFKNIRA